MSNLSTLAQYVLGMCSIASKASESKGAFNALRGRLSRACGVLAANEKLHSMNVKVTTFDAYESLSPRAKSTVKSTLSQARACCKHAFKHHKDMIDAWALGEYVSIRKMIRGEEHDVDVTLSIYKSTYMPKADKMESAFNYIVKNIKKYKSVDAEGNSLTPTQVFDSFVAQVEIILSGEGNVSFQDALTAVEL